MKIVSEDWFANFVTVKVGKKTVKRAVREPWSKKPFIIVNKKKYKIKW